jgi:hypothetical protein
MMQRHVDGLPPAARPHAEPLPAASAEAQLPSGSRLAQVHAGVAQQRVGRHHVEVEVGQRPVFQVALAVELDGRRCARMVMSRPRCRRSAPPAPTARSRWSCGCARAGRPAWLRCRPTSGSPRRPGAPRSPWRRRWRSGSACVKGSMSGARRIAQVVGGVELLRLGMGLALSSQASSVASMRTNTGTLAECIEMLIGSPRGCECGGKRARMLALRGWLPAGQNRACRHEHHHPRRLPGRRAQAASCAACWNPTTPRSSPTPSRASASCRCACATPTCWC